MRALDCPRQSKNVSGGHDLARIPAFFRRVVEGALPKRSACGSPPPPASLVPLPVPGRIELTPRDQRSIHHAAPNTDRLHRLRDIVYAQHLHARLDPFQRESD